MTPSPPESPIDYNGDPDQRPPSCGDDIDFHRDSPAKLPKTNHVPFISNTHNVARVEPLPPPINSSSKYLSDDIDMLEELKARAKAALLKEAGDQGEDILDEISSNGRLQKIKSKTCIALYLCNVCYLHSFLLLIIYSMLIFVTNILLCNLLSRKG